MIDGSDLVDALVAELRGVSALVTAVGGDRERIYGYYDRYPDYVSLELAVHQLLAPGVMVSYDGVAPGTFGDVAEVWQHRLLIHLRAGKADSGNPYSVLFAAIMTLQYVDIHASCYPMQDVSLERGTDAEFIDFFVVPLTLSEIGG